MTRISPMWRWLSGLPALAPIVHVRTPAGDPTFVNDGAFYAHSRCEFLKLTASGHTFFTLYNQ